jgi:uncharacterized protein YjiS (DUF1127 family)
MEMTMSPRTPDFDRIDFPELSPSQRALAVETIVREAHAARAAAIRDAVKWLGSKVARAWHAWRAWQKQRTTLTELRSLDDAALRDIGLRRSEIESVVFGYGRDETRRRRPLEIAPANEHKLPVRKAA